MMIEHNDKKDAFESYEGHDYDSAEGGESYEPLHEDRNISAKEQRKQLTSQEKHERLDREEEPTENVGYSVVQCKDSSFPSPSDQLRQMCALDPLPLDEERALLRSFQESHDPLVRERLLHHNVRTIMSAAKHCKIKNPLDVLDAGVDGLLVAMEKYNPALGGPLRDFAWLHVLGEIKKHRRTMIRMVRTPRGKERPMDVPFDDSPAGMDVEDVRGVATPKETEQMEEDALAANKESARAKRRFLLAAERAKPENLRRQRIIDLREAAEFTRMYDTYFKPRQRDIVDRIVLVIEPESDEHLAADWHCSPETIRKEGQRLYALLEVPQPTSRKTLCILCDWVPVRRGLCQRCLADAENQIAAGGATWSSLEMAGLALPPERQDPIRPCHPPTCHRRVHARGLCSAHYSQAQRLIIEGAATWERLEAEGRCLSSKRKVDSISIQELVRLGTPIKAIARTLNISPNTVRKVLRAA